MSAPIGYLKRKAPSKISHAGTLEPDLALSAYMAAPNSRYGEASLTKRLPRPLTTMQPGRLRSANRPSCAGSPGTCTEGTHQAQSIRSVLAPMDMAARRVSPVLCGGVALH